MPQGADLQGAAVQLFHQVGWVGRGLNADGLHALSLQGIEECLDKRNVAAIAYDLNIWIKAWDPTWPNHQNCEKHSARTKWRDIV